MSEIEFDLRGPAGKDPVPEGIRVIPGGASPRDPYVNHDEGEIALEVLRRVLRRERARRRRDALREMLRSIRSQSTEEGGDAR